MREGGASQNLKPKLLKNLQWKKINTTKKIYLNGVMKHLPAKWKNLIWPFIQKDISKIYMQNMSMVSPSYTNLFETNHINLWSVNKDSL